MAEEVALDLAELRHLQSLSKRPRILDLISSEIRTLEKLSQEPATLPASQTPTPTPTPVSTAVKTPSVQYAPIVSFSWDQDNDKVKIYIFLEGVDQEKIEADFKPRSFDIKLHDVQGKNYKFTIPNLHKEIAPEKCKVIVKPTKVIINLGKTSKDYWLDLKFKEDKLKPKLDKKAGGDPMAGIMDMMKNMYEDGDPEMKRTIAKAWTDARVGKGI